MRAPQDTTIDVAQLRLDLRATRDAPRLTQWYQGLRAAVSPCAETDHALHQGAAWLRDIASIFAPVPMPPRSAASVAGQLRSALDTVQRQPTVTPTGEPYGRHLDPVSRRSWPGLCHCDEVSGLPRTTNALASHGRETRRRLVRTTGPQGQTPRTLQRQGAWELLSHPPTEAR